MGSLIVFYQGHDFVGISAVCFEDTDLYVVDGVESKA